MTVLSIPTTRAAIVVQLYRQGRTMAQIQANTGLGREEVLAAVDRDGSQQYRRLHPHAPLPPVPPARPGRPRRPGGTLDREASRVEAIHALAELIAGLRRYVASCEAELAELAGEASTVPGAS